MKKKLFALIMAAALTFSLVGCAKDGEGDVTSSSGAGSSQNVKAPMSKEDYLKEVDGLNSASQGFLDSLNAFIAGGGNNVESLLDDIRASKQPFIDFADIDNPPEEYQEAHGALAESSRDFGEVIEKCADLFQSLWDDKITTEEYDQQVNALMTELQGVLDQLGKNYSAVVNIK